MATPQDILLIDKPKGITSFDVIRRLRRELGVRKMGHAGTLDPLASGLMLIGVGQGTKRLAEFLKLPKEYVAEILIGERRSTGDMEGIVLEEKNVTTLGESVVKAALASLVGTLSLPVSAYSAIKKDGVPMYKRARRAEKKGELIADVPDREMVVTEAMLEKLEHKDNRAVVAARFTVGSGTYIRSLAEELGRRLGYPATVYELRRTKIGDFDVKDARGV